jgi:phospholipase C
MAVAQDPIKHVVVLMFENHPFDEMLGGLRAEVPGLDGVDTANPGVNKDQEGRSYAQGPRSSQLNLQDPMHETTNVLRQLDGNNGGFVLDYERSYPGSTAEQLGEVMSYFAPGVLPALHELAREFTVCDRWFSSVPGPTWTNRFFALSGTSLGRVIMPEGAFDSFRHPGLISGYDQDTVFDRLDEAGVTWRVYHGDIPQSLVLSHQRTPAHAWRYSFMDNFEADVAREGAGFPGFCFIEPSYYPPSQDDDHPPRTTMAAQALLARVYNTLRSSEALWASTLLVVVYDEHGGLYDHVSPPPAVPPDDSPQSDTDFRFDRLGVRVPALLVSPWVDRAVTHDEFDHTSLLKYVSDKWGLRPLTRRATAANSFAAAIRTTGEPRSDTPGPLIIPAVSLAGERLGLGLAPAGREPMNPQQEALAAFAFYLRDHETDVPAEAATTAVASASSGLPESQAEAAKASVNEFLRQQKAKAAVGG